MVFTGTYEHSIDAKNRLAIPSEVRNLIQAGYARGSSPQGGERDGAAQPVWFYVTLAEGQALSLYTEQGFEQRAADLDHSSLSPEELLAYERIMFSLARRVELDKQGRILLPENLLSMAGLSHDVVLIGAKDHLEIRDRQAWMQTVQQFVAANPHGIMNPRRAMRAGDPGR